MAFWLEVAAGFLGNIFAGFLLVFLYVIIQWFLTATDITIGYSWRFDRSGDSLQNVRPSFDIRNRSRSQTYALANIAYLKNKRPVAAFDHSLWGTELKPGSIQFLEAAPVTSVTSIGQCMEIEVQVRLQDGRMFWLRGSGPGQLRVGKIQRVAFWLRNKFAAAAVPLE
ncbi:MAG TPA: hypothetical protein VGD59_04535 [Acidisarcina sp.]